MMVPYITPPAVVGLVFVFMFDGNFGVVNDLLVKLGVIDSYCRLAERSDRELLDRRRRRWSGTARR